MVSVRTSVLRDTPGQKCLKLRLTAGHSGPRVVLCRQCLWLAGDPMYVLHLSHSKPSFLLPSPPPAPWFRKGVSHSGNVIPDKQISRLGLAEIRPLEAIRLQIKQKFNEN